VEGTSTADSSGRDRNPTTHHKTMKKFTIQLWTRLAARFTLAASLVLVSIPALAQNNVGITTFRGSPCAAGRLIVKPKAGVSAANLSATHRRAGASVEAKTINSNASVVRLPANLTLEQAIKLYTDSGTVDYAEPDYVVRALSTPNDPSFPQQWGLTKIAAPTAWQTRTSAKGVVVAVLDTGGGHHQDMQANRWRNAREIAGDGRDNDGNGYGDDVHGWDFVNRRPDPIDDNDHGSHVGGIIGAAGNNRLGSSGVCWQGDVMFLKFLDARGSGFTSDALSAMRYAMDNGARIINASYGSIGFSRSEMELIDQLRQRGILLVCAAGNLPFESSDLPSFPAAYPMRNIISVAASDPEDRLSSFSTYGPDVDLAAPGVNILSHLRDNRYGAMSGTSMAAPFVAGAAALLWAHRPGESWDRVANRLLHGVDRIAALNGKVVTGGRLNVARSLSLSAVPGFPADDYGNTFSSASPRPVIYYKEQKLTYVYVGGLLETAGDIDMFRLASPRPARLRVALSVSLANLRLQVFDGSGRLLSSNPAIEFQAPQGDLFLSVAAATTGAITPYSISTSFLESQPATAPKITVQGRNGVEIVSGATTPSTTNGTDYGSHSIVDSPGIPQAFTIRNTGSAPLSLRTPTVAGPNAGQFVVSTLPATSVAPGASTTMVLTYRAAREGVASATVTIPSNDGGRPSFTFAVGGRGIVGPDDLPNTVPSNRDMPLNSSLNARLQYDRDNDVVRVYVPRTGTLDVFTTGTTDTYGHLCDGARSNHRQLAEDDNSNGGGNFRIRMRVDRGYYHIRVRGAGGRQGAYTLHARFN
jgi:subtilisin family serine protease